ncbi:hypothetical protein [Portibacter marinus]|uniref:hypothetical protein n=1 Tax=Portibacter marinus TaxID=2898660 RepID=UPI001F2BDF21|nr:hypothetical protein [Portibacter marinus]
MRELYIISGAGNSSGLKIYESESNELVIRVPKKLTSKSGRYLAFGILLLLLSIFIPILVNIYIQHFIVKMAFFAVSLTLLILGGGISSVATWELRSAIEIKLDKDNMSIFQPAFFNYRSLLRTYRLTQIEKLYVMKERRLGKEKYSLMLDEKQALDERLIKGFYVPDQALWIAEEVNKHLSF